MKRKLTMIVVASVLIIGGITAYSLTANGHDCGTCKSKGKCTACKNCKYCKNCSKDGGSCSVCR